MADMAKRQDFQSTRAVEFDTVGVPIYWSIETQTEGAEFILYKIWITTNVEPFEFDIHIGTRKPHLEEPANTLATYTGHYWGRESGYTISYGNRGFALGIDRAPVVRVKPLEIPNAPPSTKRNISIVVFGEIYYGTGSVQVLGPDGVVVGPDLEEEIAGDYLGSASSRL